MKNGLVEFDAEEAYRIDRANLAWELKKLPEEIDRAPAQDIEDMLKIRQMYIKREERALRR